MVKGELPAVLSDIHTLFHVGTSNGVTDAQLLDRFRARSDPNSSEAAFAGLLARHGPMVLGVCRRALRNPDDVADAFQATFLILVRKADTVRVEDSLGRWLYGVSRRVSIRAKRAAARRSAREVREFDCPAKPAADSEMNELRDVLDEEIGRLPEKFRSAVVLCELEGFGHDEAARHLACAVGTVKSRLSRARQKLRSRLIRRGVAPTAWALHVGSTRAAVPAILIDTTLKAAIEHSDGVISPAANLLIQGVLRAMFLKKLSMTVIAVVATLALATSAGVLAQQTARFRTGGQLGGRRVEDKVGVTSELGNIAHSTVIDREESKEQEDESIDRIQLLRFDVELLTEETRARMNMIQALNKELINFKLHTKSDANESQIESTKRLLRDARKEYISKTKELNQKQAELSEIEQKQRQENRRQTAELKAQQARGIDTRGAQREKPATTQPAASDTPGISPILEKRLSGIEGKLDNVLQALEDLKRDMRR